jgi:hypothetical protein
MVATRLSVILDVAVALAGLALGSAAARGDSLEATLLSGEVLPGELVVVDVVLTLDSPAPSAKGPDGTRHPMPVRRELDALLLQDGALVTRFALFGPDFRQVSDTGNQYRATFSRFMIQRTADDKGLEFFAVPGHYQLVVCDRRNRDVKQSQPAPLVIRQPRGAEVKAWEDYRRCDVRQLEDAILDQEGDAETMQALERIALAYPDTLYGAYAAATLALRDYKSVIDQPKSQRDERAWQRVISKLHEAADRLAREHPLREKLLFQELKTEGRLGHLDRAKAIVASLRKDFPHGALAEKTKRAEEEIQRLERGGGEPGKQ